MTPMIQIASPSPSPSVRAGPSPSSCGASSSADSPSIVSIWPPARVEALTRAWREGLSASQIAARLGGGLSRSAVIGKLHRLGVCGGAKPSTPGAAPALSAPAPLAPAPLAPASSAWRLAPAPLGPAVLTLRGPPSIQDDRPISHAGAAPPRLPGPKSLRDLLPRECRFGLGDPGAGQGAFQLFCAEPTTGHAYCAHHHAIAIQPPVRFQEQNMNSLDPALVGVASERRFGDAQPRSGAAR